jgi:hypothetical protein
MIICIYINNKGEYMSRFLEFILSNFRYCKSLTNEDCLGALAVSLLVAVVGVYLMFIGADNIFSGTFIDYIIYSVIALSSINALYLSFELGTRYGE